MRIITRNGSSETIRLDAITERISRHIYSNNVDPVRAAVKVVEGIRNNITTSELDDITSKICMNWSLEHPDWAELGSRICISNHQKNIRWPFSRAIENLYKNTDMNGSHCPLISKKLYDIVQEDPVFYNNIIDPERDFLIDYFGFKTLERSYLLKTSDQCIQETPQYLFLRVAIGIRDNDIQGIIKTYNMLSLKFATHATPTLFNSGTPQPQFSSCFLLGTEDSVEGIYKTITDCARISKWSGGIGFHISNIRCKGSYIRGTGGKTDGIIPMLKVYNNTARYIDQSGKRNGSFAAYLEPWHGDIIPFLKAMRNHGSEESLARDLFYALWIPDLFMEAVKSNKEWYLMCPDECPNLANVYGDEFERLYTDYVQRGKYREKVQARDIWDEVLRSQIESGMPYIMYKDQVNRQNNQKNLGTIKSSNLCVAPETPILTSKGYIPIYQLKDQTVEVWNGEEWSSTTIRQTGQNQNLIKVTMSNGTELECTPYHKFYIETGSRPFEKSVRIKVDAKDLKIGQKIIKHSLPPPIDLPESSDFPYAYTHGFYSGDGTDGYTSSGLSKPRITLYGKKKDLIEYLDFASSSLMETSNGTLNVQLHRDIPSKYTVPNAEFSIKSRLEWLAGILDADGCVAENDDNQSIQMVSIHKDFLMDILLMLQEMGVHSKVTFAKSSGKSLLPDGKGSKKLYETKEQYRILINSNNTNKLLDLGLNTHRLKFKKNIPKRDATQYIKVKSVIDEERIDDTFCFTENKRGTGMFGGVLTMQCAEITEYSDSKEYAVCNLASLCLSQFIKYEIIEGHVEVYVKENCSWCDLVKVFFKEVYPGLPITIRKDGIKETYPRVYLNGVEIGGFEKTIEYFRPKFNYNKLEETIEILVENLNIIIDKNYYPTNETFESNCKHRPIGIGVQGLSDLFAKMWIPYESEQARILNKEIFEAIQYFSIKKSMELAKKTQPYSSFEGSLFSEGKFQHDLCETPTTRDWDSLREDVKKNGTRNSLMVALMPTASTSQIMGNNESFEPFNSCMFVRRTLSGEFIVINKYLITTLHNLGLWDSTMKQRIMFNRGSIQKIPQIPRYIRDMYKTVWEIKKKHLINMARDRQAFVCQSQSFNLYFEDCNPEILTKTHMYSWKQGLKTGSYYIRSRPATNPQNFTIDPKLEEQFKHENVQEDVCENCSA